MNIDKACGKFFSYRDLIECSRTWQQTKVHNIPYFEQTFGSLESLCEAVLDPVSEYFGIPILTHGFCSAALARQIRKGIAPTLDQHAGYELNVRRKKVCKRGGIAADFYVKGVSSLELAQWVIRNTTFDRMYFFGENRPLHVSVSPEPIGQIVKMGLSKKGWPLPRVTKVDDFLATPHE